MDIKVKKRNGRLESFVVDKINASVQRGCEEIKDVSPSEVVLDAQLQLFDKITTKQIDQALILSAREKIEKEPAFTFFHWDIVGLDFINWKWQNLFWGQLSSKSIKVVIRLLRGASGVYIHNNAK